MELVWAKHRSVPTIIRRDQVIFSFVAISFFWLSAVLVPFFFLQAFCRRLVNVFFGYFATLASAAKNCKSLFRPQKTPAAISDSSRGGAEEFWFGFGRKFGVEHPPLTTTTTASANNDNFSRIIFPPATSGNQQQPRWWYVFFFESGCQPPKATANNNNDNVETTI